MKEIREKKEVKTINTSASIPKNFIRIKVDIPLFLITITLLIFGALMVYSASADFSFRVYGSMTHIFRRQVMFMGVGLGLAVIAMFFDYHWIRKFAFWGMLLTIFLLFYVMLYAEVRHGAGRALFGGSAQPSELAKLMTILYFSVWLYSKKDQLQDVKFGLIPLAIMIGMVAGLIYKQPDLSAAATVVILGEILFFLAGADLKQITFLGVATLLVGYFFVYFNPTGNERVIEYIDGLSNLQSSSYHLRRSIEAFITGGWFGVGIGQGDTKFTGLPFPQTDSIFAVVSEETGVIGAILLVFMYALFLWRSLAIAKNAPDGLGRLLAAGIGSWITMEAFFNIGSMLGVFPIAGNSLPLISAGGSNLLVTLLGIGIILNISRQSAEKKINEEWRLFNAVVSLRGGNGRWRVSRSRRAAGSRTVARD